MQDRVTCLPGRLSPNSGLKSVAIEKGQWGGALHRWKLGCYNGLPLSLSCLCRYYFCCSFEVTLVWHSVHHTFYSLWLSVISFTFPCLPSCSLELSFLLLYVTLWHFPSVFKFCFCPALFRQLLSGFWQSLRLIRTYLLLLIKATPCNLSKSLS